MVHGFIELYFGYLLSLLFPNSWRYTKVSIAESIADILNGGLYNSTLLNVASMR